MSNITTISEREINSITKNFSTDTGLTYSPRQLRTIEDCIDQYNKADEVSHIAQAVIKDRMQGDALLKARKIIMEESFDVHPNTLSVEPHKSRYKNYIDFLSQIKCTVSNANYLLDFAGYKEKGGEIETASHYREVKKIAGKRVSDIDTVYNEAGGPNLKTAKEVKEAVEETTSKVYVRDIFEKEVGREPSVEYSQMMFSMKMNELLPSPSEDEWKSFYRTVASCIHPDKGGKQEHAALLTSLNEMYQLSFKHIREVELRKQWNIDYKIWKEDNGYKSDFV